MISCERFYFLFYFIFFLNFGCGAFKLLVYFYFSLKLLLNCVGIFTVLVWLGPFGGTLFPCYWWKKLVFWPASFSSVPWHLMDTDNANTCERRRDYQSSIVSRFCWLWHIMHQYKNFNGKQSATNLSYYSTSKIHAKTLFRNTHGKT